MLGVSKGRGLVEGERGMIGVGFRERGREGRGDSGVANSKQQQSRLDELQKMFECDFALASDS